MCSAYPDEAGNNYCIKWPVYANCIHLYVIKTYILQA